MNYPKTRKGHTVDEFFGTKVPDPYRWLENDHDPEVVAWTQAQQVLTESLLAQYPHRKAILERMKELVNYPRQTAPIKFGDWYYYYKNDGLQNQWVTYRKKQDGQEEMFLDPNTLSPDGTTTAHMAGNSKDNRYFTYMVSASGSDAGELWTIDTQTGEILPDKLKDMRHSGASWYKDGFFYSRYLPRQEGCEGDPGQNIWYHKLGTPQEEDVLFYEDTVNPRRFRWCSLSDDEKYFFISESQDSPGNRILYRPADDPNAPFRVLFEGFEHQYYLRDAFEEDYFYLFTNKDAPNRRLVKFHISHPEDEHWQEIIPQRDYPLDTAFPASGRLIAIFTKDVCSRVELLDTEGKYLREIEMPYQGTADLSFNLKEDEEVYFYFSSYVRPNEIYSYHIPSDDLSHCHTDAVPADLSAIVSEQVFYPSKDGTLIPMTLIHRNDILRDGKTPVLLYGYGGFDSTQMPYFSATRLTLQEKAHPDTLVLLYTQTSSAHGPSSLAKSLEYNADTFSFVCMCLGVQ